MKKLLLAATGLAAASFATPASATLILTFGQTGSNTAITATENGAQTATTLSSIDTPISITQIENGVPTSAFFDLSAASNGPAIQVLGATAQKFSGTFSINSLASNTGVNYLSGVFTDVTIGAGPGGARTVGAPPDSLTLTSSVITDLAQPSALGLGFANVSPGFNQVGNSIGSFTSSVSGTFSASPAPVAEPTTLALLGVGVLGLAFVSSRKRVHTADMLS
jgi:hypothetical protein